MLTSENLDFVGFLGEFCGNLSGLNCFSEEKALVSGTSNKLGE